MKAKIYSAILALTLLAGAPASGQDRDSSIVGAWRMTSLEAKSEGSFKPVPLAGQIVFTSGGTMATQAMDPNPDAPDSQYTVNGYEAYYGVVVVDQQNNTFVVTVESSLVRNLIGQRLKRKFEVSGNKLVITPDNAAEGWRVTYERL